MKTTQHTQPSAPLDLALPDKLSYSGFNDDRWLMTKSGGMRVPVLQISTQMSPEFRVELVRRWNEFEQLRTQRDALAGALRKTLALCVSRGEMLGLPYQGPIVESAQAALASLEWGGK